MPRPPLTTATASDAATRPDRPPRLALELFEAAVRSWPAAIAVDEIQSKHEDIMGEGATDLASGIERALSRSRP